MPGERVLIIGGGISGLATAYYLGKAGIACTLIEKSKRLGGLIKTDHIQGCDLEAGPDSFIAAKTAVLELAEELGGGLGAKIISSNDAARRILVVRDGRLVPMPRGMSLMVPVEWWPVLQSPLLSARTKWLLFRETFTPPKCRADDFSVGELVNEHFGKEMLEYVTEPLLMGVYGGDSRNLSARSVLPRFVKFEENLGSLIKGARQEKQKAPQSGALFRSFEGGMQTFTDAISKAVLDKTAVLHEEVTKIEKFDGGWRVRLGSESLSCSSVVLTSPAWETARLLATAIPDLALELSQIAYSSAILATLVFRNSEFKHPMNGFGFLVPRREAFTLAAATWVKTKFPSRIADHLVAVRGFIVSETAQRLMPSSDDEIAATTLSDIEKIMDVRAIPLFRTIYRWPRSMPQYAVGHEARVGRLHQLINMQNGLYLGGNYFNGVGIPDCVSRAKEIAKQIVQVAV